MTLKGLSCLETLLYKLVGTSTCRASVLLSPRSRTRPAVRSVLYVCSPVRRGRRDSTHDCWVVVVDVALLYGANSTEIYCESAHALAYRVYTSTPQTTTSAVYGGGPRCRLSTVVSLT